MFVFELDFFKVGIVQNFKVCFVVVVVVVVIGWVWKDCDLVEVVEIVLGEFVGCFLGVGVIEYSFINYLDFVIWVFLDDDVVYWIDVEVYVDIDWQFWIEWVVIDMFVVIEGIVDVV